MYDHVIEKMSEVGVAEKLDTIVWINRDGVEYQTSETFECPYWVLHTERDLLNSSHHFFGVWENIPI